MIDATIESTTRKVRDFIYLDVPRLYSMYSQVFEGLMDRVVETRINELITGDAQSSILRQSSADSQTLEASRRTESGILHDHMYNRLEQKLSPSIINGTTVDLNTAAEQLSNSPLVSISGRAEVEDYERLKVTLEKMNDLADVIAYSFIIGDQGRRARILSLRERLRKANSSQKKPLQEELSNLADARREAIERGFVQDQQLLDNLRYFIEMFNPEGYEVVITPHDNSALHFRGVINKEWLRINPNILRSLYGGQSESPWTMLGIVTHVQGMHNSQISDVPLVNTPDNPMMLDAYRNMFRRSRVFERMFLESNNDTEIVMSPVAIYREFSFSVQQAQ